MILPNQSKPVLRVSSVNMRRGIGPAGFFDDLWGGIKKGIGVVAGPALDILGGPACEMACGGEPTCLQLCKAGTGGIRKLL